MKEISYLCHMDIVENVMTKQALELIKTRDIFLKAGEESGEVVLVGDEDGDMFFSFLLEYVEDGKPTQTRLDVTDEFHGKMTIETRPFALTVLTSPMEIGTYKKKALFVDVRVQPCNAIGEHNLTISFYTKNS